MKNLKFYYLFILLLGVTGFITSCSDDNNSSPIVEPNPETTTHFDIWVTVGGSTNKASLVKSISPLQMNNSTDSIDFKGSGVDVTTKLYQESMIKGQYYYEIPKEKDRFGKYKIGNQTIDIIKEVAFNKNTYKDRRYAHTWIDDNNLLIIASNGDATKVIWTKINTSQMTIIAEGTLDLPIISKYSTSGVASYRKSDNKIFYSYCHGEEDLRTQFNTAIINPTDMSVEKTLTENRAGFPAATAYGELLQSKSFFDTNGDYYLACNTTISGAPRTQQYGVLLRIKNGELDFDKSYAGFITPSNSQGKIVTAELLTAGKALLYVMDPTLTGATGWGSSGANCYYAVLDLNTDNLKILDLPYNKGNFSQRSIVAGNKAYIGVNPDKEAPAIYIYNIQNEQLSKGLTIQQGYSFERIVLLQD